MAEPLQPVYTTPRTEAHLRNVLSQLRTSELTLGGDITAIEGIIFGEGVAAGTIAAGEAVRVTGATGITPAQANSALNSGVVGIATESGEATETVAYLAAGIITRDGWGLTPGSIYYLSPTSAGAITTTPPTAAGQYVVQIGRAVTANSLQLAIQQSILL